MVPWPGPCDYSRNPEESSIAVFTRDISFYLSLHFHLFFSYFHIFRLSYFLYAEWRHMHEWYSLLHADVYCLAYISPHNVCICIRYPSMLLTFYPTWAIAYTCNNHACLLCWSGSSTYVDVCLVVLYVFWDKYLIKMALFALTLKLDSLTSWYFPFGCLYISLRMLKRSLRRWNLRWRCPYTLSWDNFGRLGPSSGSLLLISPYLHIWLFHVLTRVGTLPGFCMPCVENLQYMWPSYLLCIHA